MRNSISATAVAASLAWAAALAGCRGEGDDGLDAERAVAIARQHADEVAAFERWARRVAAADTTFPNRAALEEAAFAPVRRAEGVVGAWIERDGPDPWAIAHPRRVEPPPRDGWRRARLGGLDEYEVRVVGPRRYVRTRSPTSGGAMLVVTLAFE